MPIPQGYFEIRVRPSEGFGRYFQHELSKDQGIIGFFGVRGDGDGIGPRGGKSVIVAYFFRSDKWTRERAEAWVKSHMSNVEETLNTTVIGYTPEGDAIVVIEEAKWDTAYINDLPDSAFAVVEPGGEKDADGKTTPRSLRHLPYKNAEGTVDVPHLRNAWARRTHVKPSKMSKEEFLAKAERVLKPLCTKYGIEVEETLQTADIETRIAATEQMVTSIAAQITEAADQMKTIVKEANAVNRVRWMQEQVRRLRTTLEQMA